MVTNSSQVVGDLGKFDVARVELGPTLYPAIITTRYVAFLLEINNKFMQRILESKTESARRKCLRNAPSTCGCPLYTFYQDKRQQSSVGHQLLDKYT